MKLYVAGPMTGRPAFNYHSFNDAALLLRAAGYEVLCPTECDPDADPHAPPTVETAKPWDWYMRRTIRQVTESDGIALLPGWEDSRGAQLELSIANALRIPATTVENWLKSARGVA